MTFQSLDISNTEHMHKPHMLILYKGGIPHSACTSPINNIQRRTATSKRRANVLTHNVALRKPLPTLSPKNLKPFIQANNERTQTNTYSLTMHYRL